MLQPQALRYFAEVARTGSLRLASDAYFIAPSAISRQIANLEKDVGTALFERTSRGMVLTEAGQLLLDFVAHTNTSVERVRSAIEDLSQLKRGTVRLAVVEATTSAYLPGLIARFNQEHPGVQFRIRHRGTHEVAELVATDAADIGLAFNIPNREDLRLLGRIAQPMQVIGRPGHPLLTKGPVSMQDLDGAPIALPDHTFGIRHVVERAARTAGTTLNLVHESNSLQLLKALVSCTDLLTVMPRMTFEFEVSQGSLQHAPLNDTMAAQASIDIVAARGRQLPLAARTFLQLLQESCRS